MLIRFFKFFQIKNIDVFFRKIKYLLQKFILIYLIKFFLFLVFFTSLIFIFFNFIKPEYLNKLSDKFNDYFIDNLHLNSSEFSKITIEGNKKTQDEEIMKVVNQLLKEISDKNSKFYQNNFIQILPIELKRSLAWIDKVTVVRVMPSNLNISITEYEPFAVWYSEEKKYVIDKEGNAVLINDVKDFKNLIIISGKNANLHVRSLFNIFASDSDLAARIYSTTWVGNRRWDIRLDDGLLIKLPENNINEAWKNLNKIRNMSKLSSSLKTIDLRILDKIYLEYDNSVIKEIKKL
jgi:cell division septal protein FtsQ